MNQAMLVVDRRSRSDRAELAGDWALSGVRRRHPLTARHPQDPRPLAPRLGRLPIHAHRWFSDHAPRRTVFLAEGKINQTPLFRRNPPGYQQLSQPGTITGLGLCRRISERILAGWVADLKVPVLSRHRESAALARTRPASTSSYRRPIAAGRTISSACDGGPQSHPPKALPAIELPRIGSHHHTLICRGRDDRDAPSIGIHPHRPAASLPFGRNGVPIRRRQDSPTARSWADRRPGDRTHFRRLRRPNALCAISASAYRPRCVTDYVAPSLLRGSSARLDLAFTDSAASGPPLLSQGTGADCRRLPRTTSIRRRRDRASDPVCQECGESDGSWPKVVNGIFRLTPPRTPTTPERHLLRPALLRPNADGVVVLRLRRRNARKATARHDG